jgi:hypothetical protein
MNLRQMLTVVLSCWVSFWLVAPEVWVNHGDSPTLLWFATFDQSAIVLTGSLTLVR